MKQLVFNPITGETTVRDIEEVSIPLDNLKSIKLYEAMESYKQALTQGMKSFATGEEILYGYSQQDQLNYSKWANTLALDPTKESVTIGSVSNGVLTLTREQFLQFTRDCEKHEMDLYMKRIGLQDRIKNANTIEELESIPTSME